MPSVPDLVFCVVAPIFAFAAATRLTQSDGDLAGHIRVGQVILQRHSIPWTSLSSYTDAGVRMANPAWLSEVFFAGLYQVGGLALIACVTAIVAAAVHACAAAFLRRRGVDPRWALLAALLSLALGATHWLARPHMFTIAGTMSLLILLEAGTPGALLAAVPLFALWANLHGGWIFGLLLTAAYLAGDALEWAAAGRGSPWPRRLLVHAAALALAALAVLANPYGPALYGQVVGTLGGASPSAMDEFLAPDFQRPENLVFLLAILISVALLALQRRRPAFPWLAVLLGTLAAALRSGRNIALLGVSGWILLALHVSRAVPVPAKLRSFFADFARGEAAARVGAWSIPVAAALLLLGLGRGRFADRQLVPDSFDASIFPVQAVAHARSAGLAGRSIQPWTWGGYMSLEWPAHPIHVDPLKYSDRTLRSYLRILGVRPGWQAELARWDVRLAILPPGSLLARALEAEPDWGVWYRDSTAVILRRAPAAAPAPAAR